MSTKVPGKKVIGAKQSLKAILNGIAISVYIAQDADLKVTKPIIDAATLINLDIIYVPTVLELGKMFEIEVGAATACIIKE